MKTEHMVLTSFGIILLSIGLIASFYEKRNFIIGKGWNTSYPYQSIGIMLTLAGIGITVLGLLISTRQK